MKNGNSALKPVWASLEREPTLNLHRWPIRLALDEDCILHIEGEVGSVAAKKRTLDIACSAAEIRGVADHLRVAPAERRGDGAILDSLAAALQAAAELKNCTLRVLKKDQSRTLQEIRGDEASGDILVSVKDGVVALDGWVISLSHKRLAGVLAWWVPGCCDVLDGLEVMPPEIDNDDEVSDALSLVLEMDPMIPHPEQIRIHTRNREITLEGLVATQAEKQRAEQDAWCLFAVDRVVNHLMVGPAAA